jgi:hypothetical protein
MRELKRYRSCDGLEFDTMAKCAAHECQVAIPARLGKLLVKLYAAEHGSPDLDTQLLIEKIARSVMLANRQNPRVLMSHLKQFSDASMHMPLEPLFA